MAVKIFIDTSSLPRNFSVPGQPFRDLVQLAKGDAVTVFLSELVLRERESQFDANVQEVAAGLDDLKTGAASQDASLLDSAEQFKQRLMQESGTLAASAVASWRADLKANVIELDAARHTPLVWKSYFAGEGAFKSPKNRADLPDAFIFEAAKDVLDSLDGDELHVVAHDDGLRKGVSRLDGVEAHASIEKFLKCPSGLRAAKSIAWWSEWEGKYETVKQVLAGGGQPYLSELDEAVSEQLPGESLTVWGYRGPTPMAGYTTGQGSWVLSWCDAKSSGPGWLSVPFSGEVQAEVDVSDMFDDSRLHDLNLKVSGIAEVRFTEEQFKADAWSTGSLSAEIAEVLEAD